MDNIATDKDIISYVKNQFFANEISDYIIFYVSLKQRGDTPAKQSLGPDNYVDLKQGNVIPVIGDTAAMWGFGYVNIDGLVTKLFDLSLTSRICSIDAMTDWKGRLCAFEVVIEESPDHQTNITGNLIDLFRILADPNDIERLKPAKTYPCNANVIATTGEFTTLTVNDTAIDPWEQFET